MVLGYGVGACAGGVPLYVAELAPPEIRGRVVAIEQMILCLGELVAFWLNYGFNFLDSYGWWRIPLAIQVVPAVVLAYGCWFWLPPSPRWLADQDRLECAHEVLTRLHGSEAADLEIQEIRATIQFEHTVSQATWGDMFSMPVLRVTVLGMAVQFFQQITGTNSILYYTVSNPPLPLSGVICPPSAWIPPADRFISHLSSRREASPTLARPTSRRVGWGLSCSRRRGCQSSCLTGSGARRGCR